MSDDNDRGLLPFDAGDGDGDGGSGRLVRRKWHDGRWFFSVVDVVALLTDSAAPRRYWTDLKRKLHDEGFSELYEQIVQLKMRSLDGKLRREGVQTKAEANRTHFGVGREVRATIQRLGGTMPEDLPTPAESIQVLQRREQQRLDAERQPSLFPTDDADTGE